MANSEPHKNHRERMRMRFKKNGLYGFEDHEILEVLLFSVIPRFNTNGIAHALIDKFGSIAGVLSANENELCSVNGIGTKAANQIAFFGELFSETNAELFENMPLDTEERAGMYAMLRMGVSPADSAITVYLGNNGCRISEEWLYRGKNKMTDELPSRIMRSAKDAGATGILLMHNHKREPMEPSPEDVMITKRLRDEAKSAGIDKVMHVIIYDDGYLHI